MKYSTIKKCRCCNEQKLKEFLNFGKMCLSTEFPPINTKKLNKIPMNVVICSNCKLIQLEHNYELKRPYEFYDYMKKIIFNKAIFILIIFTIYIYIFCPFNTCYLSNDSSIAPPFYRLNSKIDFYTIFFIYYTIFYCTYVISC